jgi:hypothetical protein
MGHGDSIFLSGIGFAIGRTVFGEPLVNYNTKKIKRHVTIVQIVASDREWVDRFEKKDQAAGSATGRSGTKLP